MRSVDQRFLCAIGQYGECLNILTQIVCVRINGQQPNIDRQREVVGDQKTLLSRWYVELRVVLQLQQHGQFRCGMRREIEPDARLNQFRLARGLQMG
jgi:hypothetical protein